METYLRPDAPMAVNVDTLARNAAEKNMSDPSPDMFAIAQNQV